MADPIETLYAELETRDDPEVWRVLADALLDAGDPRGELVQIHAQLAAEPSQDPDSPLRVQLSRFLREHEERLVGFRPRPGVQLEWHYGHVQGARVESRVSPQDRVPVLQGMLQHPGNRCLRHLLLEGPPGELVRNFFRDTFAPLASSQVRAPATLRSLQLGDGLREKPSYWVYGYFNECRLYDQLEDLWRIFPALSALRIDLGASDLELGAIRAEQLRDFEWVSPFLADRHLEPLASASWPALERFVLWTGAELHVNAEEDLYDIPLDDEEGAELVYTSEDTLDDPLAFEALFDHLDTLPRLQTFGLANYAGRWSELAAAVQDRPFWQRLVTLDLTRGRLDDGEVSALVSACRACPSLERLVVEGLRASRAAQEALRRELPEVVLEGTCATVPSPEEFYYVITAE